jgi:uncharacterized protein YggE
MKRQLLFLLVLSVMLVGCAASDNQGEKLTLSVAGFGQASSAPDVAYIQLGVSIINSNLSKAVSEANRVNLAITNAVASQNIPVDDVQTGSYNIWREDIYNPETGQPTGEYRFHVDISLSVRVLAVEKMGDVISAALEAGANNVNGITFGVMDPSQLEAQARADAILDLQARAVQIAEGMNMALGAPITISEGSAPIPAPVYTYGIKGDIQGFGGGGGDISMVAPVSPGQTSVSVQLYAIYELSPR